MNKVTVTRNQQDEINQMKNIKAIRENCLSRYLTSLDHWNDDQAVIKEMTSDQIAAAWLGVAEIEPEPVPVWEAVRAFIEGKEIRVVDNDGSDELYSYDAGCELSVSFILLEKYGRTFYILEEE